MEAHMKAQMEASMGVYNMKFVFIALMKALMEA